MEMDGYPILRGDSVYDVAFGRGIVDRIENSGALFWVKFGNSLRSYDARGYGSFKERSLYWQDPVIIIPHKNDNTWARAVKIATAVNDALGKV
jgi:hypothetical protein